MEKLKQRWGLTSNFQLAIVFTVFAITGSTSAYLSKPILQYIGVTKDVMHPIIYWILYIVLIMPVYKVLLICIGTIFGQHTFFVNFVKKMLRGMKLGFLVPADKKI